ncbi:hypothetical protein LUZ60_012346 [Juncus effusus]|nr:hypothetical protein LUZ60_012346 [Juncus effusus]
MSALYMSHFPNFSLEGDQDQENLPTLTLANDPSLLYPFVINSTRDHDPIIEDHEQKETLFTPFMISNDPCEGRIKDHDQNEINEHIFMAESSTRETSFPSNQRIMINNTSNQQSSSNQYDANEYSQGQDKWMSSKMRLMRKMMNSDRISAKKPRRSPTRTSQHDQIVNNNNSINSSNGIIRVCSACNTTKTPLWRSGPCGPKSLCNACGIRQRKARRAALMAANGGLVPSQVHSYKVKKEKRSIEVDKSLPIKKRCKIDNPTSMASKKVITKDEIIISLNKNLGFHRVFPQDETDAAILLMALSCGLIRS